MSAVSRDPNGYRFAVQFLVPQAFDFFRSFTLPQSSALYTMSVFEVLIIAWVMRHVAKRAI